MSQERDMQKAAILMCRAAECNAKVAGMQATNRQREIQDESPAYVMDDFEQVIEETGIFWNSVCELLQGY